MRCYGKCENVPDHRLRRHRPAGGEAGAGGRDARCPPWPGTPERAESLRQIGIKTVTGISTARDPSPDLPTGGAAVFYLAPPPGGGDVDPRIRVFCGSVEPGEEPKKVVYISTSGVYGDCGGETVTEQTPPNPQTAPGPAPPRRRDDPARLGDARRVPTVILRVTGIYGPGRLPLDRMREGHPVLREEEAPFTNRIHAEDLARICLAAAEKGENGEIFNVSDGHAATMTAYFNASPMPSACPARARYRWPRPKEVMNPLMLSYLTESRRMDNRKMLTRLGIHLCYPDLAAGLRGILAEGR